MAVYAITGGLGAGKSLLAVSRIRDALQRGVPVATNMNVHLEVLVGGRKPAYDLRRIPDYPTLEDFQALGDGSSGKFDEKTFGWIVLDEAATFLNSREWNVDLNDDGPKEGAQRRAVKRRMDLIRWLRHCRKHRWHLILITQGLGSLDSQIRDELIEHEVQCRRMDRMSVPGLSMLTKALGFGAWKLPQVHVGVVYYRELGRPLKVDSWYVPDAKTLWGAYETEQKLDGVTLGASMLDVRRAPYLWEPRSTYDRLWKLGLWRLGFPASEAMARHIEFKLCATAGLPRYRPQAPTFAEWQSARAGRPGPLGAVGGEAGEPSQPHHDALEEAVA